MNTPTYVTLAARSARHRAERAICAVRGHKGRRGVNGWENFGTGIYCLRCAAMLNPDGSAHDFMAAWIEEQRGANHRDRVPNKTDL